MTGDLAALLDATWPPAQCLDLGPMTLRDGQGGGKRVSAASLRSRQFNLADIMAAEEAMRALCQDPLFVIWPDAANQSLDSVLARRGYDLLDPVQGYRVDLAPLLAQSFDVSACYPHWPPLAIARDLWQTMGIGAARLQVMGRVTGAKTVILGRQGDAPAGLCFAAVAGKAVMVHALEVAAAQRRMGLARSLLARAAIWAAREGAQHMHLVVTQANAPARALYHSLGMVTTESYHYRQMPQPSDDISPPPLL